MNTLKTAYSNTARGHVLNFVQHLEPTPTEQPFIQNIFDKQHVSMKDVKVLLDYTARRAAEKPLQRETLQALGLPSLPA